MNIPSLPEALQLLLTMGGLGAAIAFLAEQLDKFQSLTERAKRAIILALAVLIPVLAQAALQFVPPDMWVAVAPYWQAVVLGLLVAWPTSQAVHVWHKSNS